MDDRRDDWVRGVDENLASLNAGQRVWDRDLGIVRKQMADIDALLRGDPEKDTDGLMARLHALENSLNLLRAVVLKDHAGGQGLIGRVEALEGGEKISDRRWGFATAVTVAIISTIGFLITQWPKISAFLYKADPVEQAIERAKHPPRKRIHIRLDARENPPQEPPEN